MRTVPVVAIDDDIIVGWAPRELKERLRLDVRVDLAGDVPWLAEKYAAVLGAVVRATGQLSDVDLQRAIPDRPLALGGHLLHILSFAELAYTSHERGSMIPDDMRIAGERTKAITTVDGIRAYGDQVRRDIVAFLQRGDTTALGRVIHSHYGGEVTVQETLSVILGHSTHHLKQAYWFMETHMGMPPLAPATDKDLEGIVTPAELF